MMSHASVLVVLLLALFSLGQCHIRLPAVGESCTELVRRPERCEEPVAVMENVESVDDVEGFG